MEQRYVRSQRHHGIYCDGPLCTGKSTGHAILGDRYKCAVCHDTDFCANCEASPLNHHNQTHPLIKFKTPVQNVSVSTVGEKVNGQRMPVMGDRYEGRTRSTATETVPSAPSINAATQVQTVAETPPAMATACPVPRPSPKPEGTAGVMPTTLDAHYVCDLVADGTPLPAQHVFHQTWTLINVGKTAWPKGSGLKFVGGDNMLNVDPAHPSRLADLEKSLGSNVLTEEVPPLGRHRFTVTLRTPAQEGKCISYWRMTSPSGEKFGHKLWCDVDVSPAAVAPDTVAPDTVAQESVAKDTVSTDVQVVPSPTVEDEVEEAHEQPEAESSKMIFPTLEKESPLSPVHDAPAAPSQVETTEGEAEDEADDEELESLTMYSESDGDSFNTDDEYDILDASDEETVDQYGRKMI
jgi:next-to-BRCA1 protein 1